MARHIAGAVSREQGPSGQKEEEDVPSSTLLCPINKCSGSLSDEASAFDADTGLEHLVCTACGHRGYRSREGVILLFRGGYEYKFSYGPSLQTITVILSSASVNLWSTHSVHEDQLAKFAAEWSLLRGRKNQPVHLDILAEEFADFYLYFCRQ
ncbi:MAG: hypothetical protein OJF47_000902 [Nitrospira sp.]|jgi:hypothetical protein|nr:MAG: hypothetical protein OJF47_000902 [Nitrospira sp.]